MNDPAHKGENAVDHLSEGFGPGRFVDCTFDDAVWFVAGTNHDRFGLSWSSIVLNDGAPLTAPQHTKLLISAKTLLALIASGVAARKRKPRGQTFQNHFTEIKRLVLWMSRRGLSAFGQLSMSHVIGYRNFIRSRLVRMPKRGRPTAGNERKPIAPRTQNAALETLLYLVRLQSLMGAYSSNLNLYEVEESLGCRTFSNERSTPRIPDHLFSQLLSAAIEMIKGLSAAVIETEADYVSWLSVCRARRERHGRITDDRRRFGHFRIRKASRPCVVSYRGASLDLMDGSHYLIREMTVALRGACFILIAGLVGMRVSEIRSLRKGCLRIEALSDGRRLVRLDGTLYKTSSNAKGEPASWVAGWDEEHNPISLAIRTLEALAGDSNLLFGQLRGDKGRIISTATIMHQVRTFVSAAGINTDWCFATHQFRKTFARFVALSAPSAAAALMRHFKHVSIQMTERYFPNDPELINDIIEASEEVIESALARVFSADTLGGMRGREIVARNQRYREESGATELAEIVRMTMLDPSVLIVLHVYGVCLYDRSTAKCDGNIDEVGLNSCTGCVNFVVSREHLPFWREQKTRLEANIALAAESGELNLELAKQLDEANRMVLQLEAA